MAGSYAWLKLSDAITQLGQRLNITPSTTSLWTTAELTTIIQTSLRIYNSLTWTWRQDFTFSSPNLWNSLGSLPGSPRLRTITDLQVYAELEYLLMEPSNTNGVWTGTNQFSLATLSDALQSARDAIIEATNCNQVLMANIPLVPNTTRTVLPNGPNIPDVIDVERVRYIPVAIPPATPPPPTTLYRDDTVANEFYQAPLYQQNPGTPTTFSLSSEPPLSWQVDIPPNLPGTYEAIVLQSGAPFNPPTSTLVGLPDDFCYVAEWGALAELLGQEEESTDRERAAYAQQMYDNGLKLMTKAPWIELGKINGQAVSLDSIVAADRYMPEWDSNPSGFGPVIVVGGIDLIAAPVNSGVGVTVLASAPVPSLPNDYVQVSRANWDTVLNFCQARACWKLGGSSFKEALEVEQRAIQACAQENTRLRSTGAFGDVVTQRGNQQERDMDRHNSKQK